MTLIKSNLSRLAGGLLIIGAAVALNLSVAWAFYEAPAEGYNISPCTAAWQSGLPAVWAEGSLNEDDTFTVQGNSRWATKPICIALNTDDDPHTSSDAVFLRVSR